MTRSGKCNDVICKKGRDELGEERETSKKENPGAQVTRSTTDGTTEVTTEQTREEEEKREENVHEE